VTKWDRSVISEEHRYKLRIRTVLRKTGGVGDDDEPASVGSSGYSSATSENSDQDANIIYYKVTHSWPCLAYSTPHPR